MGYKINMVFVDEIKAGYKSAKHLITNEFARGIIASDARFVSLVDEVGKETIKSNHTTCKEVKNDLFTD